MEDTAGQASVSRRRHACILIAIVLLGVLLRLHGLSTFSLWYDEGCTLMQSEQINLSFSFFNVDTISDPPTLAILVRLWQGILNYFPAVPPCSPCSDALLHLLPCLFSILTVPLTYFTGKVFLKKEVPALIAAFLCAVSPFQIFYAHELKAYSLYLAITLGALYCFLQILENGKPWHWIGLVTLQTLSMYTHFFAIWNIALFNLFFALTLFQRRGKILKWTVSQLVLVLLILPAVLLASQWAAIYNSITLNSWALRPDLKTAFLTLKTFFAGYGATSFAYWPLFLIGALLFLAGLVLLRRDKNTLLLAVLLTVFPIIANVIIWRMRNFPFYEHRIFIFSCIIVYYVTGLAIMALPHTLLRAGTLALITLCTVPLLQDYYHQNLHPMQTHRMGVRYKVDNRDAAAHIASRWKTGDMIGHASHFTLTPFRKYLPDARQVFLRLSEEELRGFVLSLPAENLWNRYGITPVPAESATKNATRVWFVESWWEPFQHPPSVLNLKAWFDAHFTLTDACVFDGVTVYLYSHNPALR